MSTNKLLIHKKVDRWGALELTAKSPDADVSIWIEKQEAIKLIKKLQERFRLNDK